MPLQAGSSEMAGPSKQTSSEMAESSKQNSSEMAGSSKQNSSELGGSSKSAPTMRENKKEKYRKEKAVPSSSTKSGKIRPVALDKTLDPIQLPIETISCDSSSTFILPNKMEKAPLLKKTLYIKILVAIAAIAILLIVILVPLGYEELEYYEIGLARNKVTGYVDTTKHYTSGRHWLGINMNFVKYPADVQREVYSDISIFTTEKIEVNLSFSFTYQLRHEDVGMLYRTYGERYQHLVRSAALAALKGAAVEFSIDDYRLKRGPRGIVAMALSNAIASTIGGNCCRKDCNANKCETDCLIYWRCQTKDLGYFSVLKYFQLQRVDITEGQRQRYLKQVLEHEAEGTLMYQHEERLVRIETERLRVEHNIVAKEMIQNATAENTMYTLATVAEGEKMVEEHRNRGLKLVYETLNVTNEEEKKNIDYVITLRSKNKANLYLGFQFVVADKN